MVDCKRQARSREFEISGVTEAIATEAMRLAMHKLPMKCRVVKREGA